MKCFLLLLLTMIVSFTSEHIASRTQTSTCGGLELDCVIVLGFVFIVQIEVTGEDPIC